MRIGTSEREAAVAALGEHLAAGRLTLAEFEFRVVAANAAVARSDLAALFTDLPGALFSSVPGPGALSADLRNSLSAEGLRFLAEDLPATLTYRNYRVPGQRILLRTIELRAAVAVTAVRLVVWAGGAKRVDVPFADGRFDAVSVSVADGSVLRVVVDIGAFGPDRSGKLDFRLVLERPDDAIALIRGSR